MRPSTDPSTARDECPPQPRRLAALAFEITHDSNPSAAPTDAAFLIGNSVYEAVEQVTDHELDYPEFLSELRERLNPNPAGLRAAAALEGLYRRHGPALKKTPSRLGVCPAVVAKALALLRREHASFGEIEKVASCDPILATSLLSFANSALFARPVPVHSVSGAIAYIGIEAAKRVILTASARPLFASVALRELWQHSVDVAAIAEQLAASTKMADPGEAFVAGLIHDIGRIAIELTNADDFVIAHRRVAVDSGCAVIADVIFTGQDHGQIGATVLNAWRLPPDLVAAVRYHHRPELSPNALPSILYLSELVSDTGEVVPSAGRLDRAMEITGVHNLDTVRSDLRRLGTALALVG